jgi:hypothetical protein
VDKEHRLQLGGLHSKASSITFLRSIQVSLMAITQEMVFNFMLREPFMMKTTNSMAMEKLGLEDKKTPQGPTV